VDLVALLAIQVLYAIASLALISVGLAIIFGMMRVINLAHGVQYMLGAYLAVAFYRLTGSFFAAAALALPATPDWAKRGYAHLFNETILQADEGCDFDFMQGRGK